MLKQKQIKHELQLKIGANLAYWVFEQRERKKRSNI